MNTLIASFQGCCGESFALGAKDQRNAVVRDSCEFPQVLGLLTTNILR